MSNLTSKDPLHSTLAEWRVAPRSNPAFRPAVWARIHAAEPSSNWAGFARAHRGVVSLLLVAGVLAGALTGRTEAKSQGAAARDAIATEYVHSLDARWLRNH